jgi:hypothetical protein
MLLSAFKISDITILSVFSLLLSPLPKILTPQILNSMSSQSVVVDADLSSPDTTAIVAETKWVVELWKTMNDAQLPYARTDYT